MAEKMFVHINLGVTLNQSDVTTGGKYFNSLVFDENTGKFWAKGRAWNDMDSALNALKYFSSVAGNSGTATPSASKEGTTLNIKGEHDGSGKANKYIETEVSTSGVTIKTTSKLDQDIAAAKSAGTTAKNELDSYKEENDAAVKAAKDLADQGVADAASALAEAQKKVASVNATADKGIEVVNTDPKNPTVGIKIDTTTAGNVTLSVGANGLKGQVTIPEVPVKSVAAASGEKAIVVTPTTGDVKVNLKTDNSGNVQFSLTDAGLKGEVTIPVTDIASGEKVLDLTGTKLGTTLKLAYDSQKIKLLGKDDVEVTSVDLPSSLFQDQYLKNVTWDSTGNKLQFTFNVADGTAITDVDLSKFIDRYEEGQGIKFTTASSGKVNKIEVELDEETEKYLTLSATGLKLEGVDAAISKAVQDSFLSVDSGVVSFGGKKGVITVDTTGDGNGTVKFAMSKNELTASVEGLGSAAYTNTNAYATAAQGTKADSALQSIEKGTDGSYVTTTVSEKADNKQSVGVALTIQPVANASTSAKGLAEASDVKSYIDDIFGWEEVTA